MEQVTMPQLGETVIEGTIVRWLKREGDPVEADEPLFEVSTDKVDTEVPSAFGGVVRALLVAEGDTVPIGEPIALIGASADEPLPAADATPPPSVEPPPSPIGSPGGPRSARSADGRPASGTPAQPRPTSDGAFLSPVVRRLLDEHGLAPAAVVGTGRDGRITRADVLAAASNGGPSGPAVRPVEPTTVAPAVEPGPTDTLVPFSRARRATADHMSRSLATAAHALVATEVDYAGVDRAREATDLTYLPFVARAVVAALAEFPNLNASVGDDCLIVHRDVHLGIAVDLAHEALIVPVLRGADLLRLRALGEAVADLAGRARAHRLALDELDGATFTLTNVGAFGTVITAPIINQPQVAILSTDGVRMRPVARPGPAGEWTVSVHPVGNLSLSFDHRAVDGAYAAGFLARVRDVLETRDWSEEVGA